MENAFLYLVGAAFTAFTLTVLYFSIEDARDRHSH
jgi:hypothetical protein